jgi:hypothetical protein
MSTQTAKYCARPVCGAMFLVPGDRDPRAKYCSDECHTRNNGLNQARFRYLVIKELIRRHPAEYLEIRAELRKQG